MRRLCLLPLVFALACGGGNPIAPSAPVQVGPPNVAGSYSGTTTVTLPEVSRSASCPTTTQVSQSGATVSIAPLQLSCSTGFLSLPLGSVTIDNTGNIGSGAGTTTTAEGCVYRYTASGGFFGRSLQLSAIYTSATCLNINLTVNLTH